MTYARHVGRVGALALALGVGIAVVTAPAVACADDESSVTTGPSTESTSNVDDDVAAPTDDDVDEDAADELEEVDENDEDTNEAVTGDETLEAETEVLDIEPEDDNDEDDDTGGDGAPAAPAEESPIPEPETLASNDSHTDTVLDTATGDDVAAAPQDLLSIGSHAELDPPATERLFASVAAAPPPGPTEVTPVEVRPVQLPRPTVAEALLAIPGTLLATAIGVMTTLLTPFLPPGMTDGPTPAPIDSPMMWVMLGWVRRQLVNSTPTLDPGPATTYLSTGEMVGTLGAVDRDGDRLTYSVLEGPTNGTLTIDQSTGTYHYLPDTGYTGEDSFVVAVTDSGPDGLFGFFKPDRGHTSAVSVTFDVSVAPPDPQTGAVRGRFDLSEFDPESVTVAVTSQPTQGTLVVGADGRYLYTPDPVSRVRASYSEQPTLDSFTVTVSDRTGAAETVTVTPVVDPSDAALVYRVPVDHFFPLADAGHPLTGRMYRVQSIVYRERIADVSLVAINPDGTVVVTDTVRIPANGDAVLRVDPVTGAGYLTIDSTNTETGAPATTVSVVDADGTARNYTVAGTRVGGVEFNTTTERGYQLVQTDDPELGVVTDVLVFENGVLTDTVRVLGSPAGPVVTDAGTGLSVVTTDVMLRRSVQVSALDERGATLLGEVPGIPIGTAKVNPESGLVVVTSSVRNSNEVTVTVLDSAGNTVATHRIPGLANRLIGAPSVNAVTGQMYQLVDNVEAQKTVLVVLNADGTHSETVPLDGLVSNPVLAHPTTGIAYVVSRSATGDTTLHTIGAGGYVDSEDLGVTARDETVITTNPVGDTAIVRTTTGVWVVDSTGRATAIPGVPAQDPIFNSADGTTYVVTTLGASSVVTVLDADGVVVRSVERDGVGPVYVNTANGTLYQFAAGGDDLMLDVVTADDAVHTHTLVGGRGHLQQTTILADVVANPATGTAMVMTENVADGHLVNHYYVISADGTVVTEVLQRPQSRQDGVPTDQFVVNPETGAFYQASQVSGPNGEPLSYLTIFYSDGTYFVTPSLAGAALQGDTVVDAEADIVWQYTNEAVYVTRV